MQTEKPVSRDEIISEFLSEAIGRASVELGINGAKLMAIRDSSGS